MKPPASSAASRASASAAWPPVASARAPGRSTWAPSRSSTPSAASRASSASRAGPGGHDGRRPGARARAGARRRGAPSCSRDLIAQLGVARRREPGRLGARELQHLAATRTSSASAAAPPRGRAGRRARRSRARAATAPRPAPRARATARRRRASRRRRSSALAVRAVARRRGVEHHAAGDRGLRAGACAGSTRSPRAAATSSRSRSCARPAEPAASALGLEQRDARVDAGGAEQDLDERAVRHAGAARERLQLDVEPVALGERRPASAGSPRAGSRARSTPTRLAATRWPACARSTGWSCTSTERTRTSPPPGVSARRSPAASVPDQSVPVTTVPIPCSVKARSTGQPRRARRPARGSTRCRGRVERRAQLVEPGAAARRGLDERSARPAPCRRAAPRRPARARSRALVVDEVALGQRDHGGAHAEQLEDRDVLARLRHHAVVAGDDEQREVDAGRPRDHRAHEALVPRHVDDRERASRGQRQARVAERDRDAARALLGQPVGVDARERPHERRLAVVDVARGAERQRARLAHAGTLMRAASASPSVRQSSTSAPSETRASTAGSPSRRRAASRSASPSSGRRTSGSSASGSAPPPTRATVSTTRPADARRERLGARAHAPRRARARRAARAARRAPAAGSR